MIRYVRQRDRFRCGPIAILNALKWSGSNATARLIPKISQESKCNPNYPGTWKTDLDVTLRTSGQKYFTVRQYGHPSLKKVEECLRAGGSVIICFLCPGTQDKYGKWGGHYTLLVGVSQSGFSFTAINRVSGDGPRLLRRRSLRNDLCRRKHDGTWYPTAWYLRKK